MDEMLRTYMPQMLTGSMLEDALRIRPEYNESIRKATEAERLIALQDLYGVYIPTDMSREIYSKLYLALFRSLDKKLSLTAIRQFSENQNIIKGKEFSSIIGGADSFTIIGESGIGKSASVSRVIDMISARHVIELSNNMRIIPCVQVQTPADCSIKGLLFEVLRKVDETLDTRYHYNAMRAGATVDMLIGSVSTVALNHIGMLVVDEIQNVVNSKNGSVVVGMLTQLINNAGISICMVGTPKSALFFGQEMMLARRSLGLSYGPFSFDDDFTHFCAELFRYQYVQNATTLDDSIQIAILDGTDELNIVSLEKAYKGRMAMLHDYLYQEPVRAKKTKQPTRKNMDERIATKNIVEQDLITDVVTRAKRLKKSILNELSYCGVKIIEVAA